MSFLHTCLNSLSFGKYFFKFISLVFGKLDASVFKALGKNQKKSRNINSRVNDISTHFLFQY